MNYYFLLISQQNVWLSPSNLILGYGISSSYSPSLTSSGVREASNLSGLHSSNGTIGSDVIAPSAAVTSLSSLKGKLYFYIDAKKYFNFNILQKIILHIVLLISIFIISGKTITHTNSHSPSVWHTTPPTMKGRNWHEIKICSIWVSFII